MKLYREPGARTIAGADGEEPMETKQDPQAVIDQTDHLLAMLQRDLDATPADAIDGGEIHAVVTAARALLATGRA